MRLPVELVAGEPVAVAFPEMVEVRVAETAAPAHQGQEGTLKPARLGNGLEITVPQFVRTGDRVRVHVDSRRYLDRVRG